MSVLQWRGVAAGGGVWETVNAGMRNLYPPKPLLGSDKTSCLPSQGSKINLTTLLCRQCGNINTHQSLSEATHAHTCTRHKKSHLVLYLLCLVGFAQFDVCLLLMMWLRCNGLYCDMSFSEGKYNPPFFKITKAFNAPVMTEEQITNSLMTMRLWNNYEPILFHVCLTNNTYADVTWSYGPVLMFVCHNNMFVLMFVVLLIVWWYVISVLTYLRKFYL